MMSAEKAMLTKLGVQVAKKQYGGKFKTNDISITDGKSGLTITIRNGLAELFDKRISFIKFPQGRALYFISDDEGFSLAKSPNVKSENCYVHLYGNTTTGALVADYVGEYDLKYDDNTGWYYIKKEA